MENFTIIIGAASAATIAATNIAKDELNERKKKYSANLIALIAALAVSIMYGILAYGGEIIFHVCDICSIWIGTSLCSMVGYDKGMQLISQVIKVAIESEKQEEHNEKHITKRN